MKTFTGIAASPGIAAGPAFVFQPAELVITVRQGGDANNEWRRCQSALAAAMQELGELRQSAAQRVGETEAAIFDAQQMICCDPELSQEIEVEVNGGASAEAAVEAVFARATALFEAMDDPLFRARGADFSDVGRRVLCLLLGVPNRSLADLAAPAIIVARDLFPSDTAQMNRELVRGFCTAGGGALSHTAILARNLGLPAVVGTGEALLELENGTPVIVDGDAGLVIAEAGEAEQRAYRARAETHAAARARAQASAHEPAITRDARQVEVAANIGLPGEEEQALAAGAEGIGLLRTEFLFSGRQIAPGEEEQFAAYRPIFQAMGSRPVIARTLDIGGDKPAPFLAVPREDNPFLGWRAIRIGLDRPELLKTQLRALLRAGYGHTLKIMFPMVATVEEMQAARRLAEEARAELAARGIPSADPVEIGMMVEVPSAAVLADLLALHADFFSIGSNDLTQYTFAADRGNPAVASLTDALHPAVLRLVDGVIRAAHAAGIWVGMCGELAGDPAAIPVLLGLGLDEFSMGAAAIPAAKALIRRISLEGTRALAAQALRQPGAAAVRALVAGWLAERPE
jgi:phosphotransferase system enzyme I (PtsI)